MAAVGLLQLIQANCQLLKLLLSCDEENDRNRKQRRRAVRRTWTEKYILRRRQHGHSDNLLRELAAECPRRYRNFMRMTEDNFNELLSMLDPSLQRQDTNMREAVPLNVKLEITLRYLATGDSFGTLGYDFRTSPSTISRFLPEMLSELKEKLAPFVQTPATASAWVNIAKKFEKRWQFPRCIGAVDGKHIRIEAPPTCGSEFYNYKGFHSIVLFAIVDAEYNFVYINVGANGRAGDGAIWNECEFRRDFEAQAMNVPSDFVIIGDDAFPLRTYLMKPYSKRNMNRRERVFNYRLSRARRIVENAFGILAWRFRIFQRPIDVKVETTDLITWVACALHNWLHHVNPTCTIGLADGEDLNTGHVIPGSWRAVPQKLQSVGRMMSNNNYTAEAESVRSVYAKYFVHEGAVPWQWEKAEVPEDSSDEDECYEEIIIIGPEDSENNVA